MDELCSWESPPYPLKVFRASLLSSGSSPPVSVDYFFREFPENRDTRAIGPSIHPPPGSSNGLDGLFSRE